MNKIAFIIIFCFFNLTYGYSQKNNNKLDKILESLNKEIYEAQISYKLFKGLDGIKVFEEYSGIIARDCNNLYQQLGPMEFIQTPSFFAKLNHEDKEIMIGDFYLEEPSFLQPMNITSLQKDYDIGNLLEDKDLYKLTLTSKPDSPSKISRITLEIDKINLHIHKQTIILSTLSDFSVYDSNLSTKDLDIVKLEILFTGYKDSINTKLFNKERYFSKHNGKIQLGKEFRDFEYFPAN